MRLKALTLAFTLTLAGAVQAKQMTQYQDDFWEIDSVEVFELEDSGEKTTYGLDSVFGEGDILSQTRQVIALADELIAFGERLYKIVERGRPVLNVDSEPISVLPREGQGYAEARDLHGWQAPVVKKYRVEFKNLYGIEVTSLTFMLVYSYGGQYNGKGAYLTGVQIKPVEVNVMWGYKVDVNFKLQSVTNMGSKEDPVAAAVLMLDYKTSTVLQTRTGTLSYFVNGNGLTQAL